MPEGVEEEASPAKATYNDAGAATVSRGADDSLAKERSRLKDDLSRVIGPAHYPSSAFNLNHTIDDVFKT